MTDSNIPNIINGEEILWQGKPKQGFQLVFEDLIIIPFILGAPGIGLLVSIHQHNPFLLLIFCVIFICVIYKRYLEDIFNRKKIQYYITSEKIVISKDLFDKIVIPYDKIDKISYTEHPFNYKYGSIIFGEEETIFGKYEDNTPFEWKYLVGGVRGGINLERDKASIAFIKEYKQVYNLIQLKMNELKHVNTK